MTPTADPDVFIEEQGEDSVVYYAPGARWKVTGRCNCCGLCEVGAVGRNLLWVKEPGQPGAEVDLDYGKRLDIPVTPAMKEAIPQCSLDFERLAL